jgi:hypothetical protein
MEPRECEPQDFTTGNSRQRSPWQFSLIGLLSVMTFMAIGLAIFRSNPALSIGLFAIAGSAAALVVVDYFVRHASRRNWAALTRAAWWLVGVSFVALLALIAYVIVRAM